MVSQPYQYGAQGFYGQPYGIVTGGAAPGSSFSVSQNIYNQNYYAAPAPVFLPPPQPQPQPVLQQPVILPQMQQPVSQPPVMMMPQMPPQQPLAMSMPMTSYPMPSYPMMAPQPTTPTLGGLGPILGMIMQMMTQMMGMAQTGGAGGCGYGAQPGLPNTGYTDPLTGQYVPSSLNAGPIDDLYGTGRIWGDPHFVDPDGGKFDVMGEVGKAYNILSDKGLQFNAEFGVWKNFDGQDGRELKTIISRAGLTVEGKQLQYDVSGQLTIDGKPVAAGDHDLGNGARASLKDGKLTVSTKEYDIHLASQNGEYLDHDIKAKNAGADGVAPHGLWGQLVDGDGKARNGDEGGGAQGGGAIETAQRDPKTGKFVVSQRGDKEAYKLYETQGLFDTRFGGPFNRYQGAAGQ